MSAVPFDPQAMLKTLLGSRDRLKYFPFVFIPEDYIKELCERVSAVFLAEPSVHQLPPPLTICGDTHGQFTDTLRIFEVAGDPCSGEHRYLFMGDYVDRGSQSIENMVLLLTLKLLYPQNVYLLRGNHETEEISTVYGMRDECVKRYSFGLYRWFLNVFETMPIAAIVGGSIFCVHGGISKEPNFNVEELMKVERPLDLNTSEMVTDILWSDPSDDVKEYAPSHRGVSVLFGKVKAQEFLEKNGLHMIVRSHEFCPDGLALPFGKDGGVVTVFSASNYCGTMNSSAVMMVNENLLVHFKVFQVQG